MRHHIGLIRTSYWVAALADFVCGAGVANTFWQNANWMEEFEEVDIRNIEAGDISPDGQGEIEIKNVINGRYFRTSL